MVFGPQVRAVFDSLEVGVGHAKCVYAGMQEVRVTGIDAPFDGLKVIGFLVALGDVAVGFRHSGPFELGQFGNLPGRTQIGPDNAAIFTRRIGRNGDLVVEAILRRFIRHIHAGAGDIEFPSVIDAAQAALFVAAPKEAGTPVRAELIDQAHPALGIAESDQVLAQNAQPDRRAIGRRNLACQQRRQPIAAEIIAGGRASCRPNQQLVFFTREHEFLSWFARLSEERAQNDRRLPRAALSYQIMRPMRCFVQA
jgi:hypothetical protein